MMPSPSVNQRLSQASTNHEVVNQSANNKSQIMPQNQNLISQLYQELDDGLQSNFNQEEESEVMMSSRGAVALQSFSNSFKRRSSLEDPSLQFGVDGQRNKQHLRRLESLQDQTNEEKIAPFASANQPQRFSDAAIKKRIGSEINNELLENKISNQVRKQNSLQKNQYEGTSSQAMPHIDNTRYRLGQSQEESNSQVKNQQIQIKNIKAKNGQTQNMASQQQQQRAVALAKNFNNGSGPAQSSVLNSINMEKIRKVELKKIRYGGAPNQGTAQGIQRNSEIAQQQQNKLEQSMGYQSSRIFNHSNHQRSNSVKDLFSVASSIDQNDYQNGEGQGDDDQFFVKKKIQTLTRPRSRASSQGSVHNDESNPQQFLSNDDITSNSSAVKQHKLVFTSGFRNTNSQAILEQLTNPCQPPLALAQPLHNSQSKKKLQNLNINMGVLNKDLSVIYQSPGDNEETGSVLRDVESRNRGNTPKLPQLKSTFNNFQSARVSPRKFTFETTKPKDSDLQLEPLSNRNREQNGGVNFNSDLSSFNQAASPYKYSQTPYSQTKQQTLTSLQPIFNNLPTQSIQQIQSFTSSLQHLNTAQLSDDILRLHGDLMGGQGIQDPQLLNQAIQQLKQANPSNQKISLSNVQGFIPNTNLSEQGTFPLPMQPIKRKSKSSKKIKITKNNSFIKKVRDYEKEKLMQAVESGANNNINSHSAQINYGSKQLQDSKNQLKHYQGSSVDKTQNRYLQVQEPGKKQSNFSFGEGINHSNHNPKNQRNLSQNQQQSSSQGKEQNTSSKELLMPTTNLLQKSLRDSGEFTLNGSLMNMNSLKQSSQEKLPVYQQVALKQYEIESSQGRSDTFGKQLDKLLLEHQVKQQNIFKLSLNVGGSKTDRLGSLLSESSSNDFLRDSVKTPSFVLRQPSNDQSSSQQFYNNQFSSSLHSQNSNQNLSSSQSLVNLQSMSQQTLQGQRSESLFKQLASKNQNSPQISKYGVQSQQVLPNQQSATVQKGGYLSHSQSTKVLPTQLKQTQLTTNGGGANIYSHHNYV